MHKPEDIPQDVWDAARAATGGWMSAGNRESNDALVQSVARAILAERERCAKVAEAQAVEPDMDDADPYDMYEMGGRSTARQIADAIRKGEPT